MKKYNIYILALIILLLPSFIFASIDTNVIDEKWGKATFAYGASLNEQEIIETANLLNIENIENVNEISVSGKDLVYYLGEGVISTDSMISSILIARTSEGNGVQVDIKTPENITQISANQYANAAITAGVTDAIIYVAANRPVTGESALTGVFKAFDINNEELDQDRMIVAQEELETTNEIVQELKENPNFSVEQLNKVIAEIKSELASLREKTDELATVDEIREIINEALENYDLSNLLTEAQINRLIELFEKYQNTNAIFSPDVKEQLDKLGDRIGDIYSQAKESGLLDKIANFFKDLLNALKNLLN